MLAELGNLQNIDLALLEALGAAFTVQVEAEIEKAPTWQEGYFTDVPSADLAVALKRLTARAMLEPWITERVIRNFEKRAKVVELDTYEATVGVERKDVLYLSLRMQLPRLLAGLGLIKPQRKIYELFDLLVNGHTAGVGDANFVALPAMNRAIAAGHCNANKYTDIDGLPIFSTQHPIDKKYQNMAGLGATGYQSNYFDDYDLTVENVIAVQTKMKQYMGENGIVFGVDPTVLYYSPDLAKQAARIQQANHLVMVTSEGRSFELGQGAPDLHNGENIVGVAPESKIAPTVELQMLPQCPVTGLWGLRDPNFYLQPFAFLHAIEGAWRWLDGVKPGETFKQGKWGTEGDYGFYALAWMAISKCKQHSHDHDHGGDHGGEN